MALTIDVNCENENDTCSPENNFFPIRKLHIKIPECLDTASCAKTGIESVSLFL